MPTVDLIVSSVWVGALALVLLAQALHAWRGHRYWARSAREAARLAAATEPAVPTRASEPSPSHLAPALTLLPGGRAGAALEPGSAADAKPDLPAGA